MDLEITDHAIEKMKFYLQDKDAAEWGVRIVVKSSQDYAFSLVQLENAQASDTIEEANGVKVVIDEISARQLKNATVDFVESDAGSGFRVERPQPKIPEHLQLDLSDPLAQRVHEIIEKDINPNIAAHGGVAHLRGLKDYTVYLEMGGGCQGCAQSAATLRQGIETRIKEVVPEIVDVVDVTDHAGGVNPYYK